MGRPSSMAMIDWDDNKAEVKGIAFVRWAIRSCREIPGHRQIDLQIAVACSFALPNPQPSPFYESVGCQLFHQLVLFTLSGSGQNSSVVNDSLTNSAYWGHIASPEWRGKISNA